MKTSRTRVLVLVLALVVAQLGTILIGAAAQTPAVSAGAVFRVFLKDGQALPAYGEAAIVDDRVVFTLFVGVVQQQSALQLLSLPASSVDVERTRRYADAIRAAHYASTRGEVDYAAMTQEVQRALAELTAVADPRKRLELALEARRRLLSWSESTYGYRAREVRELTRLFDEAIFELRAAAGERQFSLDLQSDTAPVIEPLMATPTLAESIQLAIAAAGAADEADRLAILRTASTLVASDPAAAELHARVTREIELESKAGAAYEALAAEVRAKSAEARQRGDAEAVAQTIEALRVRDQALGGRRPQLLSTLFAELEAALTSVRTHRAALEHYAVIRRSLLEYERQIRPTMSGFDGLGPILLAIRDMKFTAFERLERAGVRIKGMIDTLTAMTPPPDLVDVHATLLSALRMADHGCAKRRLAVAIRSEAVGEEASSAVAGAMLLSAQAREQLVARLFPPKIK